LVSKGDHFEVPAVHYTIWKNYGMHFQYKFLLSSTD
jgi:hypothetical protein